MSIVALLVILLLWALVFWAVTRIAAAFGIPSQIVTVLHVIFVVLFVLWLLRVLGLLSGGPTLTL